MENFYSTLIKNKIKFSSYKEMYKEIQNRAVAKSYMTNGLPHIWLFNFDYDFIYEENLIFFFICVL
jgi:hypothetical protein